MIGNSDSFSTSGRVISVRAPGVLGNDVDPDRTSSTPRLRAILLSTPAHGRVVFGSDGSFTYTPIETYTGSDFFTYAAADQFSQSAPVTVTLNVGQARDTTPPFIALAGEVTRRLATLPIPRGTAADVYAIRGRGVVVSSGLFVVTIRVQRSDAQYWNGRTYQRAVFEFPAAFIGNQFIGPAASVPPSVPGQRYRYTATARDRAGNAASVGQNILINSSPTQ